MEIQTATSLNGDTQKAAALAAVELRQKMGPGSIDLLLAFFAAEHVPEFDEALSIIHQEIHADHFLAVTCAGIIGGVREHESGPALVLWAGRFPGARLQSMRLESEMSPEGPVFSGLPELPEGASTMLLFGDPFSFDAESLLQRLGEEAPLLSILGGMASAGRGPAENRLGLDGRSSHDGAVAVLLPPEVAVRPVVSQGCRPFGKHRIVTRAEKNLVFELGGKPVIERLTEEIEGLAAPERELLSRGLHLGLAIDARKEKHGRGDFLVRNILGYAPEVGALVVGDACRAGLTVQFHLRDAAAATEDLEILLREARAAGSRPVGVLLFTCNGRGTRLFGTPDHDAAIAARELEGSPLAGFFAAGEIGPVGGRNFLHGFTASLAIFEER